MTEPSDHEARPAWITMVAMTLWILFGVFFSGTPYLSVQPAFAEDTVLAADAPPSTTNRPVKGADPDKQNGKDCVENPVACVGVNVTDLPFPGCTSGKRCSLDTSGKVCNMMPRKTCQTVNINGVCKCECIQ
jgi:hypothetical protein